ncbi:MAG TPA: response regulator transcription factor [Nitrospira sp.]|nr:response regulator transcription factor [Nitrospira sp.]
MRLLVAEDDLSVAGFLEKGLREERYTVDVANDGEEALKLTQHVAYDLIILDVMLPKRNGLNVCRSIRQAGKGMPVLLLTVRDSTDDKVLGLDSGADDYLTKPFPFPELLARIRALLRRGAAPIGRLRVGDLDLDPVAHRVWRGGTEIPVTNKEYAVLEYLMRNVGRVLTRTAIIEHVWDYQYDTMTNIVDVQIRALRSKIDRPFSTPLIKTVRGVGYIIEEPS